MLGKRLFSPVLVVLVWEVVCRMGFIEPQLLPAPSAILMRMIELAMQPLFWIDLGITLYRLVVGLSLAIVLGVALGLAIEVLRKRLRPRSFVVDAILLPSPYAMSLGGFVNLPVALWFGAGGVAASLAESRAKKDRGLPADMSGTSLAGGGLIAGDALAALAIGAAGLLALLR